MESNQTSNESTEAQVQSNQTSTESNTSQSQSTPAPAPETHKSAKAPWAVAAIASVLAIAGIAFGIYGMMKPTESPTADNLKVQIKNTDGTTTTLETDKIEKTDKGTTITITDSASSSKDFGFKAENFIGEITRTYIPPDPEAPQTTTIASQSVHSWSGGATYSLDAKGNITVKITGNEECYYYSVCEGGIFEKNISSLFSKRVNNIAIGQWGNGGDSWLIVVLEDGTAETISEYDAIHDSKAKKIENAKDMLFAYGDLSSMMSLGYLQDSSGKIHTISVSDGEDGIDFSVDK